MYHVKRLKCRIDLHLGSRPVLQHQYRTGPDKREAERKSTIDMMKMDVIVLQQFEGAAPVVFGKKKVKTVRFCAGYCRLNSLTVPDRYQIQRVDVFLDS